MLVRQIEAPGQPGEKVKTLKRGGRKVLSDGVLY